MAVKRDFLDAAVSDLCREMYDWTCCRCERPFPDRKGRDIHCSHFLSRGSGNSTRYSLDNVFCLCASCHKTVGDDPAEHTALAKRILGDERFDRLMERKHKIVKYTREEKKQMARHYRKERARIEVMRGRGVVGYVEAVPYD